MSRPSLKISTAAISKSTKRARGSWVGSRSKPSSVATQMPSATRRFTRLTNAFSKKIENHTHPVALFAMYHNFVRIHKTLRTTPAVAAGATNRRWEIGDIVGVLEIGRQAMPANRDQYEKKTRDEIIAKLYEIKRISASIDAAAKAGQPLPIAAKEFLKKISIAIAECQSVVDEHAPRRPIF